MQFPVFCAFRRIEFAPYPLFSLTNLLPPAPNLSFQAAPFVIHSLNPQNIPGILLPLILLTPQIPAEDIREYSGILSKS